jgi:GntR family transcriptional regulator/MocR family aminotransferase
VIYVGTMSKVMFPGLRVGYMVVPEQLIDAFLAVRGLVDAHPSSIAQAALVDFLCEGHLAAHIRRMRALYAERQQLLIGAVRERLGGRLAVAPSAAGMHLVGQLPPGADDRAIARAAAEAGVEAPALSSYYHEPAAARGLLLGYAGVPGPAIAPAVARLALTVERARVGS